ncbi:TPA: sulfite exporter TauE/SafE family protein [Campylobacter fetus subsp. venerealis]|nr:sulfite exporter TauE/SafE family protein [Campylobacter fetus subsp. venerealis]
MILLPVFGILIGFISGFFGIGGGTVLVPIMLALGYDIKEAIGISILQMVLSATFGSFINYKSSNFILKDGFIVGLGGFVGASLSGFVVSNIQERVLEWGLLIILAISISKFFYVNTAAKPKDPPKYILFIVGFFTGVIATSMGAGGGILLTPILVGFLGMDIKKSVYISLFFVLFSSISGFVSLAFHDLINYKAGLLIAVGSLIGVYFGTKTSHKIDKQAQKWWLVALYISMFGLMVKKIFFKFKS